MAGASTHPLSRAQRGGAGGALGIDRSWPAPQSSGPSLQQEPPSRQVPMTKIGTWQGPQRLMHFRGPLYKWGHRGAERGVPLVQDVRTGNWRVYFSQNHLWNSDQGGFCVPQPEKRRPGFFFYLQATKPVRQIFLGNTGVSLMQRERLRHREVE